MLVKIRLDEILRERGITQLELSKGTSIRPASIHEMVHNQTVRMPLSNLAAVCEYLQCGICDILILEEGEPIDRN